MSSVIIDGGNSEWNVPVRHNEEDSSASIHFICIFSFIWKCLSLHRRQKLIKMSRVNDNEEGLTNLFYLVFCASIKLIGHSRTMCTVRFVCSLRGWTQHKWLKRRRTHRLMRGGTASFNFDSDANYDEMVISANKSTKAIKSRKYTESKCVCKEHTQKSLESLSMRQIQIHESTYNWPLERIRVYVRHATHKLPSRQLKLNPASINVFVYRFI